VMDAEAFSLCEANKLPIIVLSMSEKGAVKKAVLGQRIGTLVG
jgi:uridylate kinase